jgi:hypothetical protein
MHNNVLHAATWARRTFATIDLGDARRDRRLLDIATRSAQYCGRSVPRACQGRSAVIEGTYRFIRNERVSPAAIRRAGFEGTRAQLPRDGTLLALEDTTSLSYRHQVADELGKLGSPTDQARGWWVHSALLVDGTSLRTLGLAHQEWWCRPDEKCAADEKESGKWAATADALRGLLGADMARVVAVCDREADIFDYLHGKVAAGERFVVRARHLRRVQESRADLLQHLQAQAVLGKYRIEVAQKGQVDSRGKRHNRPARVAQLSLQTASVTFRLNGETLTLNAVLADEPAPPAGVEPLSWLLLTSEPVATYKEALEVVLWYSARWRIEDFHKAWKSGAGVEALRMAAPDHLERLASVYAFTAVRLLQLRESFTLARQLRTQGWNERANALETLACDTVLTREEWRLLWHIDRGRRKPPEEAPTLQWAYQAVARLGGFHDSKRTGIAGWTALWDGWTQLQDQLVGYLAARDMLHDGIDL